MSYPNTIKYTGCTNTNCDSIFNTNINSYTNKNTITYTDCNKNTNTNCYSNAIYRLWFLGIHTGRSHLRDTLLSR